MIDLYFIIYFACFHCFDFLHKKYMHRVKDLNNKRGYKEKQRSSSPLSYLVPFFSSKLFFNRVSFYFFK